MAKAGVMTNAGLEPERRSASIRYIRQALAAADPVQRKWLPMTATASKAAELRVAVGYLNAALKVLQDEDGAHWQATQPLDDAQRTLFQIGGSELDEVLNLTKQAIDEIAQHRPGHGGRIPT
jgi:hypothetical protein